MGNWESPGFCHPYGTSHGSFTDSHGGGENRGIPIGDSCKSRSIGCNLEEFAITLEADSASYTRPNVHKAVVCHCLCGACVLVRRSNCPLVYN